MVNRNWDNFGHNHMLEKLWALPTRTRQKQCNSLCKNPMHQLLWDCQKRFTNTNEYCFKAHVYFLHQPQWRKSNLPPMTINSLQEGKCVCYIEKRWELCNSTVVEPFFSNPKLSDSQRSLPSYKLMIQLISNIVSIVSNTKHSPYLQSHCYD